MVYSRDCGCDGSEVVGMIIVKVDKGMIPCDSDFAFLHDLGAGVAGYLLESGEGLTAITVATGKSHGTVHPASG